MNQRERILELVKQGVITTEEALILLENSREIEDSQSIYDEIEHQIAECDQRLSEVQADIEVLESLEGVAPLTDEQRQHLEELKKEKSQIFIDRDRLQIKYYEAKQQEEKQMKQDRRRESLEKAKSDAKDTVRQVGQKMTSFVKQTSSSVQNYVKEMVDRHQRTGSLSGKKTSKSFQKLYEFSPEECHKVNVNVVNGNIHLKEAEVDHISIDVNVHIFIEHDDVDLEALFLSDSTLSLKEHVLEVSVNSRDYVADLTITVPTVAYEEMNLKVCTGDVELRGVHADELIIKDKHGAIRLADSKIEKMDINLVNGNIDLQHNVIQDSKITIANGSLNLDGEISIMEASVMNGMMTASLPSSFDKAKLSTGIGSIEVFINDRLPIAIDADTKLGNIQNNLADAIVVENEVLRSGQSMKLKTIESNADEAELDLKAKTGSILINAYQHNSVEGQ